MLMMFIDISISVINFKFIKLLLNRFHGEFVLHDHLLEVHRLELLLQLLHVELLLKIIILHRVDDKFL